MKLLIRVVSLLIPILIFWILLYTESWIVILLVGTVSVFLIIYAMFTCEWDDFFEEVEEKKNA